MDFCACERRSEVTDLGYRGIGVRDPDYSSN